MPTTAPVGALSKKRHKSNKRKFRLGLTKLPVFAISNGEEERPTPPIDIKFSTKFSLFGSAVAYPRSAFGDYISTTDTKRLSICIYSPFAVVALSRATSHK